MAARVSTPFQSHGPSSLEAGPKGSHGPRVVSVSPRLAQVDDHDPGVAPESLQFPIIETIRVDQRASDALASLIELSRQTAVSLRDLIEEGRRTERKSNRASLHLQERLRLSARMLQAFQLQIGRVEKGLSGLREQEQSIQASQAMLTQQLNEFRSQAESVIAEAQQRLAEAVCRTRAAMESPMT